MKSLIIILSLLALSTSCTAISIQNVTLEEIAAACLAAADSVEISVGDASVEMQTVVGGSETALGQEVDKIVVGALVEAAPLLEILRTIGNIVETPEESVKLVQDTIVSIAVLTFNTKGKVQTLIEDEPEEVKGEIQIIFDKLHIQLTDHLTPPLELVAQVGAK